MNHDFYKTGDADAPIQIQDRNGEVVLSCCRRCGRAEIELVGHSDCTPVQPWWWPQPVNAEWIASIRADYPERTEHIDDEDVVERYGSGFPYVDTWDHLGDAREGYARLADAFLRLVAECGKSPKDFM